MFKDYTNIIVQYEELYKSEFIYNKPFILTVNWNNTKYEFFINLKPNASNLLVFGSGAYNPQKMKPPVFQRHSWIDHFEDSTIFYNDPTLYLGPMNLGWGHGTTDKFYLEDIADIIQIVMDKISIKSQHVLFYGSSGGGFMSLALGGFIKGAKVLVNNPQTVVSNYYESHVNRLFKFSHPQLSKGEILKKFPERLNILELYKKLNHVPDIYYLQNIACGHDMKNHVTPFISGLKSLSETTNFKQVHFDFYFDKELDHNPVDLEKTLYYIYKVKP
ncbi:glycosyl transferase family 2 [Bacillus wiedmannii]|uniref:hypothetical protein n=1 Tax=Bacillus wiedmannii TaxID=1890302 RepID=UPI0007DB05BC|nr:hypothetical protein [Bacillus wiedmannii]OAK12902.1 glycosyl transferase family 2 [Bacillus wiedmannii]OAK17077.1 glycosyl transferase family 2 [Bacillus wiedmannii]